MYKACIFDAYGTLFDLHSAVARYGAAIGPRAVELSTLWRVKQLEYSWVRSAMAPPADGWRDFWSLTQDSLDFALQAFGIDDPSLRAKLLDAYLSLDAFPEVHGMLETLKKSGMRTAIVSNGSSTMLQSALESSGVGSLIDVVCSADEVRTFKPSPSIYRLVTETLGISPADALFTSSNIWDAASGASFGFAVNWVNRTRQRREYPFADIRVETQDLTQVPAMLEMT